MKRLLLTIIALLFAAAFSSGVYAEEVKYTTHIKPIVEKMCAHCHGADAPEIKEFKKDKDKYKAVHKGPRMDSYAYLIQFIGWPDAGAVMRRLDDGKSTKDGKPGNMYEYFGATDEERQKNLNTFKEWVGNWNLKKWPDVTKEDMDKLKLAY